MSISSREMDYAVPGSHWWLVLLEGVAAILLGILLLFNPISTVASLVWFLGIYWVVTGIISLVSLFWDRTDWGWKLITGILGILAGLFVIRNPLISALLVPATVALWLGILGIVLGITQLIQALRGGGWGLGVLGVLSVIGGYLLITRPVIAGFSLAFLLGILLILGGVLAVFASFSLRRMGMEYEASQARVSRPAVRAGSTISDTASRQAGAVSGMAAASAAGVSGLAAEGLDSTRRTGQGAAGLANDAAEAAGNTAGAVASGTSRLADEGMDALRDAGQGAAGFVGDAAETAGDTAGAAASGAAGLADEGMDALRGAGQGAAGVMGDAVEASGDTAEAAASGAAGLADEGMDAVRGAGQSAAGVMGDAAEAIGDTAGAAASEAAGLAGEGMDAVRSAGQGAAGAVDAIFTGNVDPHDPNEMAKYRSPLEYIEGVNTAYAERLKAIGILNCLDLIRAGTTPKGRLEIAEKAGIRSSLILEWVNHVDLYRIKGVGSEYADLLEASGVDTVVELAQRNAANLFTKMNSINMEKKLVRRMPTQSQVEDWVAQAKGLPRLINY